MSEATIVSVDEIMQLVKSNDLLKAEDLALSLIKKDSLMIVMPYML